MTVYSSIWGNLKSLLYTQLPSLFLVYWSSWEGCLDLSSVWDKGPVEICCVYTQIMLFGLTAGLHPAWRWLNQRKTMRCHQSSSELPKHPPVHSPAFNRSMHMRPLYYFFKNSFVIKKQPPLPFTSMETDIFLLKACSLTLMFKRPAGRPRWRRTRRTKKAKRMRSYWNNSSHSETISKSSLILLLQPLEASLHTAM